jgi:hypothetical protein
MEHLKYTTNNSNMYDRKKYELLISLQGYFKKKKIYQLQKNFLFAKKKKVVLGSKIPSHLSLCILRTMVAKVGVFESFDTVGSSV